jgi:uncharacterized membrane protein
VSLDTDGDAFWINDRGQAVGYSGNCTTALHGVSWKNDIVSTLLDLGNGAIAQGINNRGQMVGQVSVPPFRAAQIVGARFSFFVSHAHVKDRLKQDDGVFENGLGNRRQIAQILGKHDV